MDESDLRIRLAAFAFLDDQRKLSPGLFRSANEAIGTPTVPNGITLCSLHHAAFDAHLMTVRPDYQIEVRRDVLEESDGPMLIHGLQGFHEKSIRVPSRLHLRPDPQLLEIRYDVFLRKAKTS